MILLLIILIHPQNITNILLNKENFKHKYKYATRKVSKFFR